jgi:hypothetical protein
MHFLDPALPTTDFAAQVRIEDSRFHHDRVSNAQIHGISSSMNVVNDHWHASCACA